MLFWIVAAAMTAAVTALVLTPLLRSRQSGGSGAGSRAAYDMALAYLELSPASFTVVDWFKDGNASLRCFNESAHLR